MRRKNDLRPSTEREKKSGGRQPRDGTEEGGRHSGKSRSLQKRISATHIKKQCNTKMRGGASGTAGRKSTRGERKGTLKRGFSYVLSTDGGKKGKDDRLGQTKGTGPSGRLKALKRKGVAGSRGEDIKETRGRLFKAGGRKEPRSIGRVSYRTKKGPRKKSEIQWMGR